MQVASTARGGSIPPNCGPPMNWQVAAGTGAAALAAISTAPVTARHFQRRKYSDTSLISNSHPVDFTNATAVLRTAARRPASERCPANSSRRRAVAPPSPLVLQLDTYAPQTSSLLL